MNKSANCWRTVSDELSNNDRLFCEAVGKVTENITFSPSWLVSSSRRLPVEGGTSAVADDSAAFDRVLKETTFTEPEPKVLQNT